MLHVIFAILTIICLFLVPLAFIPFGLIVLIPLWVIASILAEKNKVDAPPADGGAEAGPQRLSAQSRDNIRQASDTAAKGATT